MEPIKQQTPPPPPPPEQQERKLDEIQQSKERKEVVAVEESNEESDIKETEITEEQMKAVIKQQMNLDQNQHPKPAIKFYEFSEDLKKEAQAVISSDSTYISPEQYLKYEASAHEQWDKFYQKHTVKFFHPRHYLHKEFPELVALKEIPESHNPKMCELGCGVGDTIFPLLTEYPFVKFYMCDFAKSAIECIKKHPDFDEKRMVAQVVDLVKDEIPQSFTPPNVVTLIFVMSAIAPENHESVVKKIFQWMKPGSVIYFRDYGRYDFAQVNFSQKKGKKLQDNFYVKVDGTRAYYFEQDQIQHLFLSAGFQELETHVNYRFIENRKTGLKMYRVWLQGRYQKPELI